MQPPRLRLYLRADLLRSIPTPEQGLAQANRKAEQLSAKAQREMQATATRRHAATVRADDHARADADRRFAAKQRSDAAHLESLRRAVDDDDDGDANDEAE